MDRIDWRGLAEKLGTVTRSDNGHSEHGGAGHATEALTMLLGDAALRDAVDFYVAGGPGSELARSVLWMLRPPAAMERCRELILKSDDEEAASFAANLLQVVADRRVFDWLPELLESPNVGIRVWCLGVIDQLVIVQGEVALEEAMPLLRKFVDDPAQQVRQQAQQIIEMAERDAAIAQMEQPQA